MVESSEFSSLNRKSTFTRTSKWTLAISHQSPPIVPRRVGPELGYMGTPSLVPPTEDYRCGSMVWLVSLNQKDPRNMSNIIVGSISEAFRRTTGREMSLDKIDMCSPKSTSTPRARSHGPCLQEEPSTDGNRNADASSQVTSP